MALGIEEAEDRIQPHAEYAQLVQRIVSPPRTAPPADVELGCVRVHHRIRLPQHQIDRRARIRCPRQYRRRHAIRDIMKVRPRLAARLHDLASAMQQVDVADRIGDVVARA